MSKQLRRVILFGAPLFAGIINIFHPVYFEPTGIYKAIHNNVSWWITLHVLNLFGFALLGLAGYLLVKEQHGTAATAAKISLAIFIPAYAGFDSVIGIGTGILIRYANGVPINQLIVLDPAINSFWTNNIAMLLAIIGSIAWGLGMSLCAVTFTEAKKRSVVLILGLIAGTVTGWGYSSSMFGTPLWWIIVLLIGAICMVVARPPLPISLLILSGILFGTTHVVPYGPLGMACFLFAVSLLEFTTNKVPVTETMTVTSS